MWYVLSSPSPRPPLQSAAVSHDADNSQSFIAIKSRTGLRLYKDWHGPTSSCRACRDVQYATLKYSGTTSDNIIHCKLLNFKQLIGQSANILYLGIKYYWWYTSCFGNKYTGTVTPLAFEQSLYFLLLFIRWLFAYFSCKSAIV